MKRLYESDDEIRALLSSFEACSFHPSEFRHYQHLTVALWYVWRLPYAEAAEKMMTGIRRLAETYGKTGYHETITLFWLRMVSVMVAQTRTSTALFETANRIIETYADKDLIYEYYSRELVSSDRAKGEWVEPDLKPLPETEGVGSNLSSG